MNVLPKFDREETRRQWYNIKSANAINLPAAIVSVNFGFDDNLAFLIRSAACYGINDILVIGSVPDRSFLDSKTGSLYDYVKIKSFPNPINFSEYCVSNDYDIVCMEISKKSKSIYDYNFSFNNCCHLF